MSKLYNRDNAKVKDKKGRNSYPFVKVDYTEEGNLRDFKKKGGKVKPNKKMAKRKMYATGTQAKNFSKLPEAVQMKIDKKLAKKV